MFKLVVLSALLAVVVAKPGYLGGAALSYAAPALAVPSGVSYQARTDLISKPVVATAYASAPVIAAHAAPLLAAAPVVASAPLVAQAVAVPSAVSYQSRTDVVSKPVIATTYTAHAPLVAAVAPAVVKSYGYAAPGHYW